MTDRQDVTRTVAGQVLPALGSPIDRPVISAPFLAEARNWSERRQLESYVKLHRVQNELLGLLADQRRLTASLHRSRQSALVQIENLDNLREIESLQIRNQLEDLRTEADLRALRVTLEKEELQVKLAEVRLRRLALESPKEEPAPRPSASDQVASSLERIRDMDEVFRAQRAKIIGATGSDEGLSDEMREELERLEILRRTRIEKLYEELG